MIFCNLKCLGDLITRNAHNYPQKDGLIFEETRLTWKQVNERVNRFANAILNLGLKPSEHIGILGKNSHRYLEVFFGLAKTNARSIKLNYRYTTKELASILNDCEARGLVFDFEYAEMARDLSTDVPSLEYFICLDGHPEGCIDYESFIARADSHEPEKDIKLDDLVMIQYTSGTTGHSKGAMMTHRGQILMANNNNVGTGVSLNVRVLLPLPLFTAACTGRVLSSVYLGNTVLLMKEFEPQTFLEIIEREKVSFTGYVPSMFNILNERIPDITKYNTSSIRRIIYGAAPMSVSLLKTAIASFPNCEFEQGYGLTETGPYGTRLLPHEHCTEGPEHVVKRLESAGRAGMNSRLKIVGPQDEELPPGHIGEIVLYCDSNMIGYWNKPEETRETLRDGWVYTGDVGELDDDGYLFIRDRKKDMIISGGFNIYPKEVENALYEHPAVFETAVIGVPDQKWGESVLALVIPREGWKVSEKELIEHCQKHIASYKKPRRVEFVDNFPKTPLQKIQKNILREQYKNRLEEK